MDLNRLYDSGHLLYSQAHLFFKDTLFLTKVY